MQCFQREQRCRQHFGCIYSVYMCVVLLTVIEYQIIRPDTISYRGMSLDVPYKCSPIPEPFMKGQNSSGGWLFSESIAGLNSIDRFILKTERMVSSQPVV